MKKVQKVVGVWAVLKVVLKAAKWALRAAVTMVPGKVSQSAEPSVYNAVESLVAWWA